MTELPAHKTPPVGFPARRLRRIENQIRNRERQIAAYTARLANKRLGRNSATWTRAHIRQLEREVIQLREAARLLVTETIVRE
jgi:hypothetical protein